MNARDTALDFGPRILQTGHPATVAIRPLFEHVRLVDDAKVEAALCERGTRRRQMLTVERADGGLTVTFTPDREQEYVLVVATTREGQATRRDEYPLYAVDADLFGRRPWKGDFHIHSSRSDGRESPPYVAAACRHIGLDFMALTDHRAYQPSLDARDAFSGVALDLRLYPGEEVHPPENPVHIVNFGGSFSVNALYAERERYDREVERLAADADAALSAEEKRHYASCVWTFDQIRRGGGIGILCHPYWIVGDAYNVSEALQDALYRQRRFDALELIGGFYRHQMESNALAVARWQQGRAEGRDMPVVGVSDAHGCERGELFGWYYSIVFAPSAEFTEVRPAIQAGQCVAVEAVPGEFPRLFGPFRLVRFAYFLLREVFPLHDELCVEEGRLMRRFAGGDTRAATAPAGPGVGWGQWLRTTTWEAVWVIDRGLNPWLG